MRQLRVRVAVMLYTLALTLVLLAGEGVRFHHSTRLRFSTDSERRRWVSKESQSKLVRDPMVCSPTQPNRTAVDLRCNERLVRQHRLCVHHIMKTTEAAMRQPGNTLLQP